MPVDQVSDDVEAAARPAPRRHGRLPKSPSAMLNTPVELLRRAPDDGEPVSHGERSERRAAQRAVFVLLVLVALAAAAAAWLH